MLINERNQALTCLFVTLWNDWRTLGNLAARARILDAREICPRYQPLRDRDLRTNSMPKLNREDRGAWIVRLLNRQFRGSPKRVFQPVLLSLEPRALLSSMPSAPTNEEQYMLQLINRARANPPAEAARLVGLASTDPILKSATIGADLTAFVQQASSVTSLPPLAFNTRLIAAARDHDAQVLASNDQTHAPSGFLVTGAGGNVAGDGQVYYPVGQSSWSTGENVFAYSQNVNGSSLKDYVDYYFEGLMIDWGNPDFGHLKNILGPGPNESKAMGALPFSEIGIGLLSGNPTTPPAAKPENPANKGLNVGPVIVTQEFAWKSGNAFLTGAIYRDSDANNFYTPGEGLGGVTIQAVGTGGQGSFSTSTWSSGGYSLALPAGTYSVTASGPFAPQRSTLVTIGQDNVGWDVQYTTPSVSDQPVPGDYDGDGKTDIAVYRPDTATWYINDSTAGPHAIAFGQPNLDIPVPGDYDGDGKTDLAVYRPTTGQWFILGSSTGPKVIQFGTPGSDDPVPSDYDGDGKTDLAVYNPTQATWTIMNSSGGSRQVAFGQPGVDIPVPADYDGDGKADIAVYRPTTADWYVNGSSTGGRVVHLGQPGTDVPIPADYDGDHKADFAVYRTTTAEWIIDGSSSAARDVPFGQPGGGDVPVPADYEGDHSSDLALFRPSSATWYVANAHSAGLIEPFGQPGTGRAQATFNTFAVTNYGVASPSWTANTFVTESARVAITPPVVLGKVGSHPVVKVKATAARSPKTK
jgi:hypothetical protein